MPIHERFNTWVNDYADARNEALGNHPLAFLIRVVIPNELRCIVGDNYVIKGGPGAGRWASVPWVAIMNPRITDSVQRGYFVIYSLRADCSGLYLSINHSVTEVIEQVGEYDVVDELTRLANLKLQLIQNDLGDFRTGHLNYRSHLANANLPQWGAVCHKLYNHGDIPNEDNLIADLNYIMMLYSQLIEKER